ncbi:recombinase family protein [Bradyrhizobium sediminis]|uniref:Recombinase family protein n=2 Tax=Bradyrhizobium sediminis TaxID=2840469 RepID=A0A975NSS4_9BRAD|nr:recombinase family protein [Bradyrhizobium sediminis]QWG20702.1 recombinase family protein [Bradyrhizobium sediminis]
MHTQRAKGAGAHSPSHQPSVRKLRCAVYTRKSTEEGLEMEFNSLDAQREACEAYVTSQRAEGWLLAPDRYDDGGFSGGTLERPALKRLRADIEVGKVDVVVVYKIDRLSRSLMDFSRLVELFDQHKVTFVSVTQSFNTTTSMGRLTLNILLSFAQFEREVIGERIRDKFAASRKRGMWMGGWAPLGYEVRDRKLVVNEADARLVRSIFQRFLKIGSATTLARQLIAEDIRNKYGKPIDKGILYKMLNNPVYIGVAVHKGVSYPGEHVGIIDRKLWDKIQARLQESPRKRAAATRAQTPSLLKGLIFGPTGIVMSPTHTRKNGRLYRYYLSQTVLKQGSDGCPVARVPAAEIERIVIDQVRGLLLSPEVIVQTWRIARKSIKGLTESDVRSSLLEFDPLWNELFPTEQSRIIELLVERVDVRADRVDLNLRIAGVTSLLGELTGNSINRQDAA